ncbi:signal transducing adapter molecule 1-like [Malaya genurostris]|uniref:signal transducing adapter molecule 1-like n=1 Tax=Malaya genurostris TaxID=325434 RepID=UPI0026F3E83C|nr:signal transducing adapter molecule 1-like [Malaya genurostris]
MGILGNSSLATDIEKATSDTNTQEKWGLIMEVCDKVTNGAVTSKDCLSVIVKRLNHNDPHVVMQAITLLDACVSNCGKQFHLEVASRNFETEFKKLLQKSQSKVNTRLKLCLKKWAESEFKSDPQLNLIPTLYQKLRSEGQDFSDPSVTPKREIPMSTNPNVVSSQQEEDDIAKAIELSLKESKSGGSGSSNPSPKMSSGGGGSSAGSSLYPTALLAAAAPVVEPRKVRALYDFEAAEDNELTFQAGEIIMVLDDSDPNWWKGQNQRGEGLFPSNFVTSDLNAEPEGAVGGSSTGKSKKNVQFSDEQKKEEENGSAKDQTIEINEEKIDRLLHLLHEADPEDPSADTEEMLQLEQVVNQMGPLIDTELERVDRKHAQLTQLSSDLVEAINLYHTLMREPDRSMMMGVGPTGYGMPGFPGPSGMPGMYSMPGMYNQNMPGMYPTMNGMPGAVPPYGMPQLRHDLGQMNVSSVPQFPPPQQAMPTMSQTGPASLPSHQLPMSAAPGVAMQTHVHQPQVGPNMHPQQHQQQQSQHMPNMTIPSQLMGPPQHQQQQQQQQQHPPATNIAPHTVMNMSHMQSSLPPNFSNPTSPPPTVSSAPSSLVQQQMPMGAAGVTNQSAVRPPPPPAAVAATATQQQPQLAGNYANYVPPQPQPQQLPQSAPPVPVNVPAPPQQPTATAPPPNSMNPHQNHSQMTSLPPFQSTTLPPYIQMPPGMAPGGGGGGFGTHHLQHHHMLGIIPPGGPLTINTATSSPQNIPIYQQQRAPDRTTAEQTSKPSARHSREVNG